MLRILPVLFFAVIAIRSEAAQKNVLLLIGDDHGLQVGCYGDRVAKTPNLDRLAAEGIRFSNAYCTTASCSPSRSVLLTGMHTHSNGQYGLAHAEHKQATLENVRSLPRILKESGYKTGVIGKLHVNPESVYPFDLNTSQGTMGNRNVQRMAELAKGFMADSEKPFFLLVGFADPHRAAQGFANDRDYPSVESVKVEPVRVAVPAHLPDSPEVRADLAEYYQSVARLDQGVGLALKALEEAGKAKDTLVVYLSDNGMPFPGAKTTLYDSGIHLPLIVRSPAQSKRGIVNQAMVSWVDIAPTILEWSGAAPAPGMQGRSFLAVMEQENPDGWDMVFASHQFHEITMYYPMRAIRTRKHKMIWNLAHPLPFPFASDIWASPSWQHTRSRTDGRMGGRKREDFLRRPEIELYDLEKDPNELRNLAFDRTNLELARGLHQRLVQMMRETKDPWLPPIERERKRMTENGNRKTKAELRW